MKKAKKMGIILLSILFILLIPSCVNFSPIIPNGRWESDDPTMYIDFGIGGGTAVSGVYGLNNHVGELINEDGTLIKVAFRYVHGDFSIYLYSDEGYYSSETVIYEGSYKLKEDTLTLELKDGGEIIMKKVSKLEDTVST